MGIIKRYGRFTLCEGWGQYFNRRYEIWEDGWDGYDAEIFGSFEERWANRLGIGLRYWSSDKEKALAHFEEIKEG